MHSQVAVAGGPVQGRVGEDRGGDGVGGVGPQQVGVRPDELFRRLQPAVLRGEVQGRLRLTEGRRGQTLLMR